MAVRFTPAQPLHRERRPNDLLPRVHRDGYTIQFSGDGGFTPPRTEKTGPTGKGPSARSYRRAMARSMAEE